MRLAAETHWPPEPERFGFLPRTLTASACVAVVVLLVGSALPTHLQPLTVIGLFIPIANALVQWGRVRTLQHQAETWRGPLREGATPLPRAGAILTLSADGNELQCHLPDGRYARQPRDLISGIQLLPPEAAGNEWSLRLENEGLAALRIFFERPQDAEGWRWRLLYAWPEWGLEHAKQMAVDVVLPAGSKLPASLFGDWISGQVTEVADDNTPILRSVSPDFAQGFVDQLTRHGLSGEIMPTGITYLPALARIESRSLATVKSQAPRFIVSESLSRGAQASLVMTLILGLGVMSLIRNPVPGSVPFFLIVGLMLALGMYRRGEDSDFTPFKPSEGAPPGGDGFAHKSFVLIQPSDPLLRYGNAEGMDGSVPISEIRGLHFRSGYAGSGITIQLEQKSIPLPTASPRESEHLLAECYVGLRGHPDTKAITWPTMLTVVLEDEVVTPAMRMKLREEWLHLEHLPLGRSIPPGPLVGPVTAAYGLALEKFLLRHSLAARVVPYDPDAPPALSLPPGGPSIIRLAKDLMHGSGSA